MQTELTTAASHTALNKIVPINLVTRWMPPNAFLLVPPQDLPTLRVPQTVLAEVELRGTAVLLGIGALVPDFHLPLAHLDATRAYTAVPPFSLELQFFQIFLLQGESGEKYHEIELYWVNKSKRVEIEGWLTIFSLAAAWASRKSLRS